MNLQYNKMITLEELMRYYTNNTKPVEHDEHVTACIYSNFFEIAKTYGNLPMITVCFHDLPGFNGDYLEELVSDPNEFMALFWLYNAIINNDTKELSPTIKNILRDQEKVHFVCFTPKTTKEEINNYLKLSGI